MLLTAIFSTVLLNAYIGNIKSSESQLKELADVTPVHCFISNMCGSKTAGLEINERIVERLETSEYTKDVVYTVKIDGALGDMPPDEWYRLGFNVMGLNSINAVKDFTYDDITMDGDKEAFFTSDENIAIFSRKYMSENGLKVGDEIPFTIYYFYYDDLDVYCAPLDVVTVRIAGQMQNSVASPEGYSMDVLFPAAYLKTVFDSNNVRFFADSLSFYLKDPLKINEAKQEFKDMVLLSRSPDALESYIGICLNMKDATFISLAGNIVRNISLLKIFVVPLCLLMFVLGVLISFILMRNRRRELVTMRLLGIYEYQCVIIYLAECLIISLTGVVSGNMITDLTQKSGISPAYSLIVIFAFVTGTVLSAYMTKREMKGGLAWK